MIYLKSENEIEKMRESAQIVSRTLGIVSKHLEPGVETGRLDRIAEEYVASQNARPAFKGYGPKGNEFPGTLCISVNEEVVHGIPGNRVLQDGDVVSIDCGVEKDGFFGDHAYTFVIGEVEDEVFDFVRVTLESLYKGIEQAVHGNRMGDLSNSIQTHCENQGYGIVRALVGHGLGRSLHEDPSVPNYGRKGKGDRLRSGMTLAVEPMVTMGDWKVKTLSDGWTVVTADHSISAHFEHDIVIREGEAEILSTFDYIADLSKNKSNLVHYG
ncbi:MAG: type I methionyl aminopeptidase [Bacteroidota bacterium]